MATADEAKAAAAGDSRTAFVMARTHRAFSKRTVLNSHALAWFLHAEQLLAPHLTEGTLLRSGSSSLNVAITTMYCDSALGSEWLQLFCQDHTAQPGLLAGLKMRLLQHFARTRSKAFVTKMKQRMQEQGIGVRTKLKVSKATKAAKANRVRNPVQPVETRDEDEVEEGGGSDDEESDDDGQEG